MNIRELREFYTNHLKETLLPFWLNNAVDKEYGGLYTCFDNSGKHLVSTDKYTWSQGRIVWFFSKLSELDIFSDEEKRRFIELAGSTADFLMKNCLLPNGNCTFIMERDGTPKIDPATGIYDSSTFADCFVVLGLSRYAAVTGNIRALEFARDLYRSIMRRFETKTFTSEPYPVPEGMKTHGLPMMVLNISWELCRAMEILGMEGSKDVDRIASNAMKEIMTVFVENDVIHEMVRTDGSFDNETLLGRYINPGHTIEDMWFVIYQAQRENNEEYIKKAARIIKKTFEKGWDSEAGGILLFADKDGGKPKGSIRGFENEKMVGKVLNDWDNKLWWPHSEALYTTLLLYSITDDPEFLELYGRTHEYTFRTFPNEDREVGEWIQIRDRFGAPQQKVVALPVKDPFHIIRNVALIIELLGSMDPDRPVPVK